MYDYNLHKKVANQAPRSTQKPATDMPDLPMKTKVQKPAKTRAKRQRKPTMYERPIWERVKAVVTGKTPKKLTKKRKK